MVYIRCDAYVDGIECNSDTFHLNFAPPLRCFAVCTECESETEIGGDAR